MNLGQHANFILAAYAAAILIVGGLITWVLLDYRTQLRKLADMNARGVTRRSEQTTAPSL